MSEEAKQKKKVYIETSFVSYLTVRATMREPVASWQAASRQWWEAVRPLLRPNATWKMPTMTTEMPTFDTPIDEIYWIRQQISAQYDHDPHKYYLAMVEDLKA